MSRLSTTELRRRVFGADSSGGDIFLAPLLEQSGIKDAAVDVRLGRHFLLTRRARIESIDPMCHGDVTRYQEEAFVNFGDFLVLHPDEAVLGVVLEYLRLPPDVSCYVMTRSSWGRVDITIATAVTVHPCYSGCLTLEIENKGTVPVKLYPGARLGQLVFHHVEDHGGATDASKEHDPARSQYAGTTKPMFSGVFREASELARFRAIGDKIRGNSDSPPSGSPRPTQGVDSASAGTVD